MATCRSCGAEIRWEKTANGSAMPLDAKAEKRAVMSNGVALMVDTFMPHFATCPQGPAWSKKGAKTTPV